MTYEAPPGYRVGLEFTQAYEIPPGYRVGLEFAPSTEPPGETQQLFPAGFEPVEFGAQFTRHAKRYLSPLGISVASAGLPTTELYTRYLRPAGIAGATFGAASLLNWDKDVYPAGTRMDVHGQSTIYNLDRYITAGGLPPKLALGKPTIFNQDRYYNPAGFDALRLGTAFLQGGVVEVGVQPIAAPAASSGAWVSRSPRTLSMVGIFREFPTLHTVGGTRWLTPVAFEATQWGERIIPASQTVFPVGAQGAYGLALVWNYSSLLHPVGFRLIEDQRFGGLYTRNLRQYVQVTYDPNDGLSPPPQTGWTAIHNRNRVITHHSTAPSALPRPSVELGARAMLPVGVAAPTWAEGYKAGMAAYRVRSLPVEGLEAPYLSTWSSVHNDGRLLLPPGFDAMLFGIAVTANTRRYFPYIGGFDAAWHGYPMVADRVRTLSFEGRYTIGSPTIRLPEVKLQTRYVDAIGYDAAGFGGASLSIHWTLITPRWTLQHFFGYPAMRNLTPELGQQGRNSEEFGNAFVRLEWRAISTLETFTQRFGQMHIADKTRRIVISGFNALRLGDKLTVVRTGAPPYTTQFVDLSQYDNNGEVLASGDGIPPPDIQVSHPILNQQVLYVVQDKPNTLYGIPIVEANSIRVEPGYGELLVGEPMVGLRIRTVTVDEFSSQLVFDPPPVRITPHTIWAVMEAPKQAKDNHPPRQLHYVDGWNRPPGAIFARPVVTLRHRTLRPGSSASWKIGTAKVQNKRHYVLPSAFAGFRSGWHSIPGPQDVEHFASSHTMAFGSTKVSRPPYVGPQTVKGAGKDSQAIGAAHIEHFNRTLLAAGRDSLAMGTRLTNDKPYMWQGLRVGPLMPTIPAGFNGETFGGAWASMRVREINPEGTDHFASEYDYRNFAARMRVSAQSTKPPARRVFAGGADASQFGWPTARLGLHYIRPDGNADQHRKGVWQ